MGGKGHRDLLRFAWFLFLGSLAVMAVVVATADPGPRSVGITLTALFVVPGLLLLLSLWCSRVWLYPDAIETRGIFIRKRMEKFDIAARRIGPGGEGPSAARLLPKSAHVKALKLPPYLETDSAWIEWFASIPEVETDEG